MRTKRKAIAIIKGDHVLIREQPPLRQMEFSEATGAKVILCDVSKMALLSHIP